MLAAVRQVVQTLRPPEPAEATSPFASTWQATHAFADPTIRMIINTSSNPDHVGGNANIRMSPMFRLLGYRDISLSLQVLAHERVQQRMVESKAPELLVPTDTYFSEQVHAVPVLQQPGDPAVSHARRRHRRRQRRLVPPLGRDRRRRRLQQRHLSANRRGHGGSIDGEIDALDKLIDMSVTEFMSQGGTMIVPGHGWISDAADVGYYRDMLMVIRDRIQAMIDKGMTLAQVKAAKPTMDFDPEYGREPGVTARFVEAVYRSLKEKK